MINPIQNEPHQSFLNLVTKIGCHYLRPASACSYTEDTLVKVDKSCLTLVYHTQQIMPFKLAKPIWYLIFVKIYT